MDAFLKSMKEMGRAVKICVSKDPGKSKELGKFVVNKPIPFCKNQSSKVTRRKIAKNCLQTSCFFGILSCQNAANTSVFRRFALRAGSNQSEENTGIYDTF